MVSADLDGYIVFWCVTSSPHPKKNKLLCYIRDESDSDVFRSEEGEEKPQKPYYPIRAIDYDPEEQMLYTGDESGKMIKWNVSRLIAKLNMFRPQEAAAAVDEAGGGPFITSTEVRESIDFVPEEDIEVKVSWKAHQDLINQVTFIPDLE